MCANSHTTPCPAPCKKIYDKRDTRNRPKLTK